MSEERANLHGDTFKTGSIDNTLKERGARYGKFTDHARIAQVLKDYMHTGRMWPSMTFDQKEALDMVMHKIGRIVNGDPDYVDSWTDIIGYCSLVEKRLLLGETI